MCNRIKISDNYSGKALSVAEHEALRPLCGLRLKELCRKYDNLLVFPLVWGAHKDGTENQTIFSLEGDWIRTGNIAGFFSVKGQQIAIHSRFDTETNHYFLHYLLQQVFGINMVRFSAATDTEGIWDFLLYLFPGYLVRACRQGIFRSYRNFEFNDDKVRGSIDLARHLRLNFPFSGRIAYRTREHSADNPLNQLIRHTVEYIRNHEAAHGILSENMDIRDAVETVREVTPGYNRHDRMRVIAQNLRPARHPYFTEYSILQKVCLQILRHEKISYGENEDQIHGILFDVAWLWEEYLAILLKKYKFEHPDNRCRTGCRYLYEPGRKPIYPDFWREDFILDAKYKIKIGRLDRYQMISYLHVTSSKKGYFIHPTDKETKSRREGCLLGHQGDIGLISVRIPSEAGDFEHFISLMQEQENAFSQEIDKLLGGQQPEIQANLLSEDIESSVIEC